MAETVSPFPAFRMERCGFGMRDPDAAVTIPERVLAGTCEKTGMGTRSDCKKAIGARKRTGFTQNKWRCDRGAPQFCFQLFPAAEPRRPSGDLGLPDMTIPVSSKRPAPPRVPASRQANFFQVPGGPFMESHRKPISWPLRWLLPSIGGWEEPG